MPGGAHRGRCSLFDLSVDLAKDSVEYSTGDVLSLYGIIITVVLVVLFAAYKTAKKNSSK
jgi:hypothetical protein